MSYEILITDPARDELKRLKKDEPKAFMKAMKLIHELIDHPFSGTGKPEQLKFDKSGLWSRKIIKKHRLVYQIKNKLLIVIIVSARNHYDDR